MAIVIDTTKVSKMVEREVYSWTDPLSSKVCLSLEVQEDQVLITWETESAPTTSTMIPLAYISQLNALTEAVMNRVV